MSLKKVRTLQAYFKDEFEINLASSSDKSEEVDCEILIGNTNRIATFGSKNMAPRTNDCYIGASDTNIVVTAYTEERIIEAIDTLIAHMNDMKDSGSFFDVHFRYTDRKEYTTPEITVGKVGLEHYSIFCEDSAVGKKMAGKVSDIIRESFNYSLRITTVADSDRMIVVGNTELGVPLKSASYGTDKYYIGVDESKIYLYGSELKAGVNAIERFASIVEDMKKSGVCDMEEVSDLGVVEFEDTSIKSMTFNLYYQIEDDQRVANVIDTIKRHSPDTLGVQEATGVWMNKLKSELGDEYGCVGVGRKNNGSSSDEFCAVFYKKSRFEVIESGTKWLSETPDVEGSQMSGAKYPRIFTYALLRDKLTGESYLCMNTHTDHVGDGGTVRYKQVQVIVDFIRKNYKDVPIILTGDLNDQSTSSSIQYLLSTEFDNSSELAYEEDISPTFSSGVIDYLLLTKDDFIVYSYDVDTELYNNEFASDHRAVVIEYIVK